MRAYLYITATCIWFFAFCITALPQTLSKEAYSYNEKGVAALKEGRYIDAIEHFEKALTFSTENRVIKNNLSNAYNNYGLTFLKKGQYLNAIDYFKKSLNCDPDNAYALLDIGQAYYYTNDIARAHEYFAKAHALKPNIPGLADMMDKAKKEARSEDAYKGYQTEHFVIVSEQNIKEQYFEDLKPILEDAYGRIGAFLGLYISKKTNVVLMSADKYDAMMSGKPDWADAAFDGKIRLPVKEGAFDKNYLRKIVYHEFAHAVMRELSGKKEELWLSEGVACYAEGFILPRDKYFFANMINKDNFVPFSQFPRDQSLIKNIYDANLLYREFYLCVEFIVEKYGEGALVKLIKSFGEGNDPDYAFRSVLNTDISKFDIMYKDYVFRKLSL